MRRIMLLVAATALTVLVASGVALAVTRIGTAGPDTLRGTNGADQLVGEGGNDILLALGGNDTLLGGPGKDIVNGGSLAEPFGGNKTLVGGEGNDAVQGGLGSDNSVAQEGNDLLLGGEFDTPPVKDTLSGGDGKDVIDVFNKPAGEDVVTCGGGLDRVHADSKDLVAPDCERVFVGERKTDAFIESIPESFFEGLHPLFTANETSQPRCQRRRGREGSSPTGLRPLLMPLFTEPRRRGILRTSPASGSQKFAPSLR